MNVQKLFNLFKSVKKEAPTKKEKENVDFTADIDVRFSFRKFQNINSKIGNEVKENNNLQMVDDEEDEMQSEQLPDKVKEMIARSGKNPITLFSELFTKVRKIHNQQNGYLYL